MIPGTGCRLAFAAALLLAAGPGRAAAAPSPTPPRITLGEADYRDRVRACWLGRHAGGILGAPCTGKRDILRLSFYDPLPAASVPAADLDIPLTWLEMLRTCGPNPSLADFAAHWQRHLAAHPRGEHGFCARNLERGLLPPVSGQFENCFVDETGSLARAGLWACLAPADPQRAAALAWMDSQLDHAGGEGVHAEMLWAAVGSAAFVLDDPETLLRVGLAMIPPASAVARAVREALWCRQSNVGWEDARNRIHHSFGQERATYAPPNCGFIALGLLYGRDFGDRLCKTVNCGCDTRATGATAGAILGIAGGTKAIPDEWRAPVGEEILLSKLTRGLEAPPTLAVLSARVADAARQAGAPLGPATRLPDDAVAILFRSDLALAALRHEAASSTVRQAGVDMWLHYGGEPVLRPGVPKTVGVSLERAGQPIQGRVTLTAPDGWSVEPAAPAFGQTRFVLRAEGEVPDRSVLFVRAVLDDGGHTARFTLLGPGEAKGYPAGEGVPACAKCGARRGTCGCPP